MEARTLRAHVLQREEQGVEHAKLGKRVRYASLRCAVVQGAPSVQMKEMPPAFFVDMDSDDEDLLTGARQPCRLCPCLHIDFRKCYVYNVMIMILFLF